MNAVQPSAALRVLLYALAAIEALAGLVLLVATSWVLTFAPSSLGLPGSGMTVVLIKAFGLLAIGLGYLLCAAARDPVRYIAVLDTMVFLLAAESALNIYGLLALNAGAFYPAKYLIAKAAVQIVLAVAIIALRPKRAPRSGR